MVAELAGSLSEQVVIETWESARDDAGADAGAWRRAGTVFASVLPDAGPPREVQGAARRSGQRWQVMLRAPVDVGLTSRLLWRGRVLLVRAMISDPRQPDRLVVRCTADVA
jgi:head-tail adaptor